MGIQRVLPMDLPTQDKTPLTEGEISLLRAYRSFRKPRLSKADYPIAESLFNKGYLGKDYSRILRQWVWLEGDYCLDDSTNIP